MNAEPRAAVSTTATTPAAILVIFGATGDLTSRMLMPALAALEDRHELGALTVVGIGRTELSEDEFALRMGQAGESSGHMGWRERAKSFRYVQGDYGAAETYARLAAVLADVDEHDGTAGNRLYYLATPPSAFAPIVGALGAHGLSRPPNDDAFARIVIEKPFGHDLQSAIGLQRDVESAFDETQVYRIDHFLAK